MLELTFFSLEPKFPQELPIYSPLRKEPTNISQTLSMNKPKGKKEKKAVKRRLKSRPASSPSGNETKTIEPEIEILPAEGTSLSSPFENTSSSKHDIVPFDALSAYLREMRRHPRLSKEEEHELALKYREDKDLSAAYKLVTSNLWLVVKLARDYERAAKNLLDLIQEGNIGLMEAVKNFDPHRGVRFPSYAVWWVKAYIIRYLIANWRLVKIGTTQAQRKLFFNLNKEKEKLEREGFYPGPKLLAEKLNVKEREVVEMQQRLGAPDVSVDAPIQGDSETPLLAVLPSTKHNTEELVVKKELMTLIRESLQSFTETLNENEQKILAKRLLSEEKATLQDLAEELSLSRERIRQIENRIKEKLKDFLLEKHGSLVDQLEF